MKELTLEQAREEISKFDKEKKEVIDFCNILIKERDEAIRLLIETNVELEQLKTTK